MAKPTTVPAACGKQPAIKLGEIRIIEELYNIYIYIYFIIIDVYLKPY